jgi:hypothetical protein
MFNIKIKVKKTSIIIPIGKFSFFSKACLENVIQTCGSPELIDIIFLGFNEIDPKIKLQIKKQKNSRLILSPFNESSNHLKLLDWSVRNVDKSNWFITQHCDLFWEKNNWLKLFRKEMNLKNYIICPNNLSYYTYKDIRMNTVGDFLGAYNRSYLINENLFFNWGKLGKEVFVSPEVQKAINKKLIFNLKNQDFVKEEEWMDGSQAIMWESYVKNYEKIKILNIENYFNHLLSIFRISEMIKWNDDKIEIDYNWALFGSDLWIKIFTSYSYLTSFLFCESEVDGISLPWEIFMKVVKIYNFDISNHLNQLKKLDIYKSSEKVIGNKNYKIKSIRFGEKTINLNNKKKYKIF